MLKYLLLITLLVISCGPQCPPNTEDNGIGQCVNKEDKEDK